jgi:hypothetical protein
MELLGAFPLVIWRWSASALCQQSSLALILDRQTRYGARNPASVSACEEKIY